MNTSKLTGRRFLPNVPNHVYRRSYDSGVVFYSDIDRLIYHSIRSVCVRRAGAKVYSSCLMFNHTHDLVSYRSIQSFRLCEGSTASIFAKLYNSDKGIRGPLIDPPFGSAPKRTDKDVRSCANYIANNASEKKLCLKAVDYRWNYLAFSNGDHPFSEPFVPNEASQRLRSAIRTMRRKSEENKYLEYGFVRGLYKKLSEKEWQQFLDITIKEYLYIDFDACARYYGGLQNMLVAPDSNTGNEFDIKEEFGSRSHVPYCRMVSALNAAGYESPLGLPFHKLKRLIPLMNHNTGATFKQIALFLHIPEDMVKTELFCNSWNGY